MPVPTAPPLPRLESIPQQLRDFGRGVGWRYYPRDGKWTKMPVDVKTAPRLVNAKSNDPSTWAPLELCLDVARQYRTRLAGIGLVLGAGTFGIDMDDCVNPAGMITHPEARRIVDLFATYTEVSPSGTGLHIYGGGSMPAGVGRVTWVDGQKIEYFDEGSARFFTVTGAHFAGTPFYIEDRQDVLTTWHGETFGQPTPDAAPVVTEHQDATISTDNPELTALMEADGVSAEQAAMDEKASDLWLIADILRSQQAVKFWRLFHDGDISGHGNDHSRADMALCVILGYRTQNRAQIDRVFRQSKLMRAKWERDNYRNPTINSALPEQLNAF